MYKLVILIESIADSGFESNWPQFLRLAESMPGLVREATSREVKMLYGEMACSFIYELYFDSLLALQQGLASPQGQEAGRLLQMMTGGHVKLLYANHQEDTLENIRRYRSPEGEKEVNANEPHA
jgi:hypothetical protein